MSGKTGNKNISLNVKIIHLLCYSKYFISTFTQVEISSMHAFVTC
ncbi:hypothetical protein SAMN04488121_103215 [Chitinophaga filiformis]|uniref:Uncharacterized protein n=1 Tax=Chitinophaga filiformis TaxID=104663 RepID=A0A1G7QW16_CHIFI|nr:hypothetical protein SAMN04488121_103215 [Chitinophaga filiformis]